MRTAWTGAQYSVFRVALGGYLALHFAQLLPHGAEIFSSQGMLPDASASPLAHAFPNLLAWWDPPLAVALLLALGVALGALLALGLFDRAAALGLWYIGACLLGRNPLISNPALPYLGWMLLAHAMLPPAPFGSWAARGRPDASADWRMPAGIFAAAWIVMAAGYTYSGVCKLGSPSWLDGSALAHVLANPLARPTALRELVLALPPGLLRVATWGVLALECGFAPLALLRRTRPWVWSAMLLAHVGITLLIDFADLSFGMLLLHGFTFDPRWLQARGARRATLFYDGGCGLCQWTVRFVLSEDRGQRFRFAPLGGERFAAELAGIDRSQLPDSVLIRTQDGRLLTRSAAVLYVLDALGGLWRALAILGRLVPGRVRDALYDAVARARPRGADPEFCPILPSHLRARFAD
jgi:predicted DCC family thiol-disulfide oxidoreductase YuxK